MEASAAPAATAQPRMAARLLSPRLLRLASDERLVAYVRAGSQAAYEVIYDRHHRGILSFCRHMLGSREEAEDAVQHTFMAAYRDMVGSSKEIQLRAWLYAVARNRCLSLLRARRERPSDGELADVPTEGLAAAVQRRADLQDMLHDLAELPEHQRAALVLSELGDLGHDEIGAILGCPREKVKALVFQARTSLQQSREARETSCQEIREMLSTLSGGALRRTALRRHVGSCPGCREFEAEVKRQRRALAVVLPVVPTLGLKESALAASFAGKGAAAGAAAASGAAVAGTAAGGAAGVGGTSALLAKVLVVAAVASGGSVAGYQAVSGGGDSVRDAAPAGERPGGPDGGTPSAPAGGQDTGDDATGGDKTGGDARGKSRRDRSERGRELARTRGKGKKRGLLGTQPGKARRQQNQQARMERAAARQEAKEQRRSARKPAPATGGGGARPQSDAKEQPAAPAKPVHPQKAPEPAPEPTPEATAEPAPQSPPEATPGKPGKGKP